MADYKRFIAYIYLYDKNTRVKNVGFVKVEIRNSQCKLDMHIKGLYTGKEEKANLYLFHRPANAIQVIPIGSFRIINGMADYKGTLGFYNVADSGLSMDDIGGMIVETESGRKCATEWDDIPIDFENVYYGEEPENKIDQDLPREEIRTIVPDNSEQQEENFFPQDDYIQNENVRPMESAFLNIMAKESKRPDKSQFEKEEVKSEAPFKNDKASNVAKSVNEVKEENVVKQANEVKEVKAEKQANEVNEVKAGKQVNEVKEINEVKDIKEQKDVRNEVDKSTIEKPLTAKIIEKATDKKAEFISKLVNEVKENEASEEVPVEKKSASDINEAEDAFAFEKSREANKVQSEAFYRANMGQEEAERHLNMEDMEANRWKQYLEAYPSIHPVEADEETQYVKIVMKDIGSLAKKEWTLMNNSFLIHGYYNYRYLILGKNMQTNECIIGIPGYYHQKEQMMASMFGFPVFRSAKNKEIVQGDFGYWIKDVEI